MALIDRLKNQHGSTTMTQGALLLALGYIAVELVRTKQKADLWPSVKRLSSEPWGAFTLKDFYANIALISLYTLAREKKRTNALLWIASYIVMGSAATIPYALKQLFDLPEGAPARDVLNPFSH